MIKILHLVGLAHGGVGEHLLSLTKGCDANQFESVVAMDRTSSMLPQFTRAGVRVVPLALDHFGGLRRNAAAFRQIAHLLRRERFDIVNTHTSVAGALGRLAARACTRAPVVHMIHAFAGHPYRSPMARKVGTFIERRLDAMTDWYIAGSSAMIARGVEQRIFARNKVVLISNGIDLVRFPYQATEQSVNTSRASAGDQQTKVGFLGRLEKQKGVPYLIQAASLVCRQNSNVRFVIAGEGSMRASLEHMADELQVRDRVEFVGWQQDSVSFLRQIDMLAMPSLWEAFGLSAAEAMALGKPVIASEVEGLPEVVVNGQTGILVPPADPQALAQGILELAADTSLRLALGRQGRARVEERFTLDRMVLRHQTFYAGLAGACSRDAQTVSLQMNEEFALSTTA